MGWGCLVSVIIFANKFRGFDHICFEVKQSNFVTGDNSSGKSSVLHLVDYVFRTELNGDASLNNNFVNDKYDFFSPYFKSADVDIGFVVNSGSRIAGKQITLKKRNRGHTPEITKFTFIDKKLRLTVKKSKSTAFVKLSPGMECVDVETLRAAHEEKGGFKKVHLEDEELDFESNSIPLLYAVIRALGVDSKTARNILLATRPGYLSSVQHSGPVRALPEPFYRLDRSIKPSGAHFASMWIDMSEAQSPQLHGAVRRFGKESGLFDELFVEKISSRLPNSPLIVKVKKNGREFDLGQVGVGVSQVMPVIIDSIFESDGGSPGLLLLQQPELHLHPVAQAALGEFIYSMTKNGVSYFIETHSDYLMDRYRSLCRDDESPPRSQIVFCENGEEGNRVSVINILPNGELEGAPENYKEFFVNELLRTMF